MIALDVPPGEMIEALTEQLKKESAIKPLDWTLYAKTGHFKEFPPDQDDWWYRRGAALLRTLVLRRDKPIGVGYLRKKYGGPNRRGVKPRKHAKGSGSIIRKLMQQLDKAGYIMTVEKKGRVLTSKGKKVINKVARDVKERHPELQAY